MTDPALILLSIGGFICVICLLVGIWIQAFPGSRFTALAVPLLRKRRSTLSDYNGFSAFTKNEVGDIERCIPSLQKVIIISSIVENPSKSLLDAVFDNFQQGVKYIFLVSMNGSSDSELSEYRNWFKSIYTSARGIAPATGENSRILSVDFTELFSVRKLNVDWDSVPYIFYVYADVDETNVLALRGGDEGSGISTMYFRVHPHDAAAIIELSQSASRSVFEGIAPSQVDYSGALPRTQIEPVVSLRLVH